MIDQFYLVLIKNEFQFNSSDPTSFSLANQKLNNDRNNIINSAIDEVQAILGVKDRYIYWL